MRYGWLMIMPLTASIASAVIIDQIAIVIGDSIIKDSDIERDLRVTEFLNGDPLDLSNSARKKAASRLIDQVFIRREIQIGGYASASFKQTDEKLAALVRRKYKTNAAFEQALRRYGISEVDLRTQLQWQLTILNFVDIRFKPAVMVTDEEIEKYYNQHAAALEREHPGNASLDEVREEIRNIIAGEKENQEFFRWLDEQRKDAKIQYLEASLR
jgi:parvulin-like peptidyl-prolyl isomerase